MIPMEHREVNENAVLKTKSMESERETLISAVNNAARVLLSAEHDETFESSILEGMKLLGQCVDADRVYIMKNVSIDDVMYFVYQFAWVNHLGQQGTHIGIGTKVPFSFDEEWAVRFPKGDYINGPLRSLSPNLQAFFSRIAIKSVLVMPIFISHGLWGLASFSDCRNERYFSDDEVSILQSGVMMMVSALERYEQAIESRNLAARLKAVVSNYPGIICAVNKDYQINLFDGLLLQEIHDKDLFMENRSLDEAFKKEEYRHIKEKLDKTMLEGPQDWSFEAYGKIIRIKTTPIQDEKNHVSGVVGCIDDVTGMHKLQSDLKDALIMTQKASSAKSHFLANMSHEMRTQLNAIIGLSLMTLEEDTLSDEVKHNTEKVYHAGTSLLGIVNDILDVSKIEAGKLELVPVEYDMPSLIHDTITQNILQIADKPIRFKLDMCEKTFVRLRGDELRVKQIINNLLSNAIKYTDSGTVMLYICSRPRGDKVLLTIKVSDTGRGIKPEDKELLFFDYAQLDLEANRTIEGTGLGLPITQRLVEMMEGTINVESEYGKGSVFTVKIMQDFVSDAVIGPEVVDNLKQLRYADSNRERTAHLSHVSLPNARVLVVDDDATNRMVTRGLLKPYHMWIDCVESAQQSIEAIRTQEGRYDAIFMDHMMPVMNGVEAVQKIREIGTDYARDIPIIALTANATIGNRAILLSKGFQDFITKPIDLLCLDEAVRRWIHDKPREAHAQTDSDNAARAQRPTAYSDMTEIFGIDVQKGLDIYLGDAGIYLSVLRVYAENTSATLEKLRHVTRDTLSDYAARVHAVKGASANIGAEEIKRMAEELELKAKAGDFAGVLAGNEALFVTAETLVNGLKMWLAEWDSKKSKPKRAAPDPAVLEMLRQSLINYDMIGIDEAMDRLERSDYETDADRIAWLKEKIMESEFDAGAERLAQWLSGR